MAKKALSINFPVERAILSDVLPYEVPIIFSNRHHYNFLCQNSIKYEDGKVIWTYKDDVLDNLIKMLLGIKPNKEIKHQQLRGLQCSILSLEKNEASTVPFIFSTTHKQDQLRQLSLMHPKAQLFVVDFYREFKDLIVYYAGRSDLSLRSPRRVAGCTYIDSRAQIELSEMEDALVEVEGDNYENLRSFFVYERFSNVFKFYESSEHLSSEREFRYLTKFDISSCFDSIYTHSIAWAIYGKEFAKTNLPEILKAFPGRFDSLMQKINYNETNGILIGPEISRIFAEIILQAVDVEVCRELKNAGLVHGRDFRIYRYVDDFFVFYNREEDCHQIKMVLQESLKIYKLSLNKGKEETLARPMITRISIAKKRISTLLDATFHYDICEEIEDGEELPRGKIYIGKSSLITEFKSILATSGVDYGEILNYSLSIIEKKIELLIDAHMRVEKTHASEKGFTLSIDAALAFVFFIYAVSPKVNTTIKLCRICQRIISFYQENPIGLNYGALVYQRIYEECSKVLSGNFGTSNEKIEVMYLLVLMRQLGNYYRIDEVSLGRSFGFASKLGGYESEHELNYFSIITLLFYIGNKSRYTKLRAALHVHINEKFERKRDSLLGHSEMLHLALDLVTCPYIGTCLKKKILSYYGVPENSLVKIQQYAACWFTKWGGFDLSKELDSKVSQEVY